ncbi:hypothetical protein IQ07DRAFT_603739 [Pyrenochaeta sp. DS3sAY3a]|nr:hypothetical protein IQ07DRAFT_603739 [Pyrenochaeta sp. DS3sAY3a]
MEGSYFTRSRAGCRSCKKSRVKCDERRPVCSRCDRLCLKCAFSQQLRWVDEPGAQTQTHTQSQLRLSPVAKNVRHAEDIVLHSLVHFKLSCTPIPRILLPPSLCFSRPEDSMAFDHWTTTLKNFICLDPDGSYDMHVGFMSLVCEPNSAFLLVLLAYVASHLAALGIIQEATMLSMSQRALAAMVRLLDSISPSKRELQHQRPKAIPDNIISSAMLLASSEILRGSPTKKLKTLLHGVKALIVERCRHHSHRALGFEDSSKDFLQQETAIFRSTADAFISVDALTGLPCPRAPIMQDREWYYQSTNHRMIVGKPQFLDPLLGYCIPIFEILGDSRIFLENWFQGGLPEATYFERRAELLFRYDELCENLPPQCSKTTDSSTQLPAERHILHNESVFAAIAHALASKVYLLRATDYVQNTPQIAQLVEQLREAILRVPIGSSVITIMLWPLWVLGCESYEGTENRANVQRMLSAMHEKEHILNIKVCLQTLIQQIWTLHSVPKCTTSLEKRTRQAAWVRYCWERGIELTFA